MEGAAAQIVIVEDDEGVARLQQKRLQRAGYRAQTFARPEEAAEFIQQHAVDLMILDYRLPDQRTGLDFYEDLKERGHDIPAILVTGFANEAMIITALRAGMKDFVSKSAEYLDYLPEAVGRVLRQTQIERRLAETEARFETVFRSSPIGIAIQDAASGRFLDANDAYLKILACSRQQLIGATSVEVGVRMPNFDRQEFLARLASKGSLSNWEVALTNCKGAEIVIEVAAEAIDLNGTACLLIMAQDMTESKRVAEQLRQSQKMEAIGRLAGGVAHDFNNILTVMLGNTELALEDLDHQRDCRELLQEILQAGRRAAGLTRQLLAFSRRQVLEPRVLELNAVVTEAERMLKRLIGEDILLSTALDPKLRKIKADPVQLEQILLNLTVNARDAMPKGGKLLIETRNVDLDPSHALTAGEVRPGPYVMLAVSDTGAGMNLEIRSRIFEPFFTTKERGRGTGLGLSTVYGIVQQSGGYIWVYSEPDHGTTFKIFLPQHMAAGQVSLRETPAQTELRGTETLLLVEDELQVRAIARRMLEGHGYRVLEASSGEEALEIARDFSEPIHLLVADVIMPGMSGRQLAEAFTAVRPATRVLYVSGYTDNTILHHGVLDQGVAFLQKPFSQESLTTKVRQVLDAASG